MEEERHRIEEEREREQQRREEERDREHRREEQMHRLMEKFSTSETRDDSSFKRPKPQLGKFQEGVDDVESYLSCFEGAATAAGWPKEIWGAQLVGLLAGDGQRAVKVLTQKQKEDYQKVKATLLDAYQVAPETYRQKFLNHGYIGTNWHGSPDELGALGGIQRNPLV